MASSRPARILVSIFSGRRSIRLFGQKLVVFFAPGPSAAVHPGALSGAHLQRPHPLKVALGYTAGAVGSAGRKPKPVIKPIRLVP